MFKLLIVEHKPNTRSQFPYNWKVITSTRLAVITEQGDYWVENFKKHPSVISTKLVDLTA